MDTTLLFITLGGIILTGLLAEWIFKRFSIPDVLILILTGAVLKAVFQLEPESFATPASAFSSFALLYILFHGGLNLRIRDLLRSFTPSLTLTTASFLATSLLATLITLPLTHDVRLSLLAGFILGGTSSAVVIPLTHQLPIRDKLKTMLILESALSDVYSIILSLSMISLISTGSFAVEAITREILTSFAVAILLGMSIGLAWLRLLQKYPSLAESGMLTIAIMLLLAGIVQSKYIHASSAIAVLTFGIILGNAKTAVSLFKKKTLPRGILSRMDVYDELSFLIKTFFFIYLGILLVKPSMLELTLATLLTLSFYAIRPVIVHLTLHAKREEALALDSLIPKGLAAAVLISTAVQQGVIPADHPLVNSILWTIILSIIMTSLLILLAKQNIYKGLALHPSAKRKKKPEAKMNAW